MRTIVCEAVAPCGLTDLVLEWAVEREGHDFMFLPFCFMIGAFVEKPGK